jgi:hypothetical protein
MNLFALTLAIILAAIVALLAVYMLAGRRYAPPIDRFGVRTARILPA